MAINFIPSYIEWMRDRRSRKFYSVITEEALKNEKSSDTVFICGTGYSLLSIKQAEWAKIGKHDVLSFRCFPKQSFVKVGFHMTGEIDNIDEYAADINKNPLYADTKFIVQEGILARMGNRLIGSVLLRPGAKVFRYKRTARGIIARLSPTFSGGIVHGYGSVCSAVNIAYLLGWTRIVLVGIDLYDHRHFYHPPDRIRTIEKPGVSLNDPYVTSSGIIKLMGLWQQQLNSEGKELLVYNSRSLLSQSIPVFKWVEATAKNERKFRM